MILSSETENRLKFEALGLSNLFSIYYMQSCYYVKISLHLIGSIVIWCAIIRYSIIGHVTIYMWDSHEASAVYLVHRK